MFVCLLFHSAHLGHSWEWPWPCYRKRSPHNWVHLSYVIFLCETLTSSYICVCVCVYRCIYSMFLCLYIKCLVTADFQWVELGPNRYAIYFFLLFIHHTWLSSWTFLSLSSSEWKMRLVCLGKDISKPIFPPFLVSTVLSPDGTGSRFPPITINTEH